MNSLEYGKIFLEILEQKFSASYYSFKKYFITTEIVLILLFTKIININTASVSGLSLGIDITSVPIKIILAINFVLFLLFIWRLLVEFRVYLFKYKILIDEIDVQIYSFGVNDNIDVKKQDLDITTRQLKNLKDQLSWFKKSDTMTFTLLFSIEFVVPLIIFFIANSIIIVK